MCAAGGMACLLAKRQVQRALAVQIPRMDFAQTECLPDTIQAHNLQVQYGMWHQRAGS